MADINDLKRLRAEAIEAGRKIIDTAEAANRDLTSEEQAKWDELHDMQGSYKARIDRAQAQIDAEGAVARAVDAGQNPAAVKAESPFASAEYLKAFDSYARKGANGITSDIVGALQVGTNSEGGYIVPVEYETRLIQSLDNNNVIRGLANVITSGSDRMIPVEASTGAATWTAEEAAYTESDPAFGQLSLGAHKLGRIIKVSEELLQDAFFDLAGYIAENFGRTFGIAEEAAFVSGDGSGKPTGFVGGAQVGVTAASTTAITMDELLDLHYSLKRVYRDRAAYFMNDATIKVVRKLKDADGQYLWQRSIVAGEPDMFNGRPLYSTDGMATGAANAKTVAFGDLSYYQIMDRAGIAMQRLNELYAANGQVGFKMFKRTEGKLLLPEAVKVLQQAAA